MRCAELILERGHGKPAQPQEQTGEKIIPLAERLAYYARRDEIEASGGKVVTLPPPAIVFVQLDPSGSEEGVDLIRAVRSLFHSGLRCCASRLAPSAQRTADQGINSDLYFILIVTVLRLKIPLANEAIDLRYV